MKITVVIPTRERGEVLAHSLRTALAEDYDGLEVLISDNCSTDDTREIVASFGDPRIRYVNTGERVSMSHNWEFALSHVSSGWVMILGDDDGIVPGALDKVSALVRETGVRALNSTFATYIWPRDGVQSRLLVPMKRGHEVRESRSWLERVVRGRAWYSELPMLYAGGAVDVELINQVRAKKGSFFQSNQPDIFSAIAFASVTARYAFSHEPFAVAGHSRFSNGASWSASGKKDSDASRLAATKMFFSEGIIPFHRSVPTFEDGSIPVSIDLLVWESYQQAMYLHGNPFGLGPQDQLALFKARKLDDRERMERWTALFAARHGLDPVRDAEMLRVRARVFRDEFLYLIAAFRDHYRLEPQFGVRMRNIYEASLVTAAILRMRPGRLRSYAATVSKHAARRIGGPILRRGRIEAGAGSPG